LKANKALKQGRAKARRLAWRSLAAMESRLSQKGRNETITS